MIKYGRHRRQYLLSLHSTKGAANHLAFSEPDTVGHNI